MEMVRAIQKLGVFHDPDNYDLTANDNFAYLRETMIDLGMLVNFLIQHINS